MVNLPILHDLLKRGMGVKEELIMIKSFSCSGMNYVVVIKKRDKKKTEFINSIRETFDSLLEKGYSINDIVDNIEKKGINLVDNFVVERSIFMLFQKEL